MSEMDVDRERCDEPPSPWLLKTGHMVMVPPSLALPPIPPPTYQSRRNSTLYPLPNDLVADILAFCPPVDLISAELVCRSFMWIIMQRGLWKALFYTCCLPVPTQLELEPVSWKIYYHRYERETQRPVCILRRNDISRKYCWRVRNLMKHLKKNLEVMSSTPFTIEYEDTVTPWSKEKVQTSWRLLIQRVSKDGKDQIGVFLEQCQTVRCFFTIGLLDQGYKLFCPHAVEKLFAREGGDTCGWHFPIFEVQNHGMLDKDDELLIELDLTILPQFPACVDPFYKLISSRSADDRLKQTLLGVISELPPKAKKHLQVYNGGPTPLVELFEDVSISHNLLNSVAGTIWNILDTSNIYLDANLLNRVLDCACTRLIATLDKENDLSPDTSLEFFRQRGSYAPDGTLYPLNFSFPTSSTTTKNHTVVQQVVNTLCGLLWNLPVSTSISMMLAAHWAFFPSLAAVLSQKEYCRTHFSCLHLLTSMKARKLFPTDSQSLRSFSRCLSSYIIFMKETRLEEGVSLSHRDVVDFFVPLLFSGDLDCILFAKWAFSVFYHTKDDFELPPGTT